MTFAEMFSLDTYTLREVTVNISVEESGGVNRQAGGPDEEQRRDESMQ